MLVYNHELNFILTLFQFHHFLQSCVLLSCQHLVPDPTLHLLILSPPVDGSSSLFPCYVMTLTDFRSTDRAFSGTSLEFV